MPQSIGPPPTAADRSRCRVAAPSTCAGRRPEQRRCGCRRAGDASKIDAPSLVDRRDDLVDEVDAVREKRRPPMSGIGPGPSSSVAGPAAPPAAGTCDRPVSRWWLCNTITPDELQVPPRASGALAIVTGAPPSTATFISLPLAKNPRDLPSGDQNGCFAPSVPAMRRRARAPRARERTAGSPPRRLVRRTRSAARRVRRRAVNQVPSLGEAPT